MVSYRQKNIKPKLRDINKKSIMKRPSFWLAFAFIAFTITSVYIFVFCPQFQVAQIKLAGYEKADNQTIEKIVWDRSHSTFGSGLISFSSRSIFMADLQEMVKEIHNSFPIVSKVQIQKEIPGTISLTIEERQPVAALCVLEKCFSIDKSGVIFAKLDNAPQDQVILKKESEDEMYLGKTVVSENTMNIIIKVQDILKNSFQVDVKDVLVSNPLVLNTSEGWKMYFDPSRNTDLQIAEMNSLLESEITLSERENLQYIYLQYKDRAYYK